MSQYLSYSVNGFPNLSVLGGKVLWSLKRVQSRERSSDVYLHRELQTIYSLSGLCNKSVSMSEVRSVSISPRDHQSRNHVLNNVSLAYSSHSGCRDYLWGRSLSAL